MLGPNGFVCRDHGVVMVVDRFLRGCVDCFEYEFQEAIGKSWPIPFTFPPTHCTILSAKFGQFQSENILVP